MELAELGEVAKVWTKKIKGQQVSKRLALLRRVRSRAMDGEKTLTRAGNANTATSADERYEERRRRGSSSRRRY